MNKQYVATFRALFMASSDVDAIFIADLICENGKKDLDEEDGDSLDVTQVTDFGLDLAPEETLTRLRQARNLLIKTRLQYCWDVAKELDKAIWALEHRDDQMLSTAYDYGRFLDFAKAILNEGKNPLNV